MSSIRRCFAISHARCAPVNEVTHSVHIDPAALDALLAPWNHSDAPGLVAGVAHPTGNWRAAYGLASLELPVTLTPRTRMRIGSISKMFTCLSVMLLAEQGKVDIDTSVRRYLPELPDWAEAMTVRQFMTHTSGMRCHIDILIQTGAWARPAPATALATLARQRGVNFAPGERWNYNNSGYNLLSLVVERVSGQSFEDFLAQHVLTPIGMSDTAMKCSDSQLLANSASLHVRRADGSFYRGFFGMQIAGEGAMVSTVEDMLLWLRQLRQPIVGSAETWRAMTTPATLADGRISGYGLGLSVIDYRGVRLWCHAGGVPGGVAMCITAPDLGLDVILIANRGDAPVQTLAFDIVDTCVAGLAPSPDAFDAPPVTGLYHDRANGLLLRLEDKDGRQALSLAGAELPILRLGETRIVSAHPALDLVVDLAQDGSLMLDARGTVDRFERIEAEASPEDAARIAGVFACDEVECVATIRVGGDTVTMRLDGPYGRDLYALDLVRPGLWTSHCTSEPESGLGGVIEFAGNSAGFTLSTPRTCHLPFIRIAGDAPVSLVERTLPAGST
jgi:CubicO group peptidase (beta-lactamase class C family)